ncbi:MAG: protein-L-isoaspartate O-methyltransferase [Gammaproteobacteria bacterium]|nr:protein-L-isoaspartate O-methyltransferase [Gammaproteobacteria bacterium]MBI5615891.1 protein-L-isoaspartate O-methyltransferase [Gammaproteobacteria bacterium]
MRSAALVAGAAAWNPLRASTFLPFTWDLALPADDRKAFVDWMVANRLEDAKFLGQRWDRLQVMVRNKDVWEDSVKRAFLMTPRDEFVPTRNRSHAYDNNFLDIGYGVTISGPHLVGHMTSSLGVARGAKVLEIGTGSGYQSAVLAHLTDQVFSIEIIKPLAERTRGIYDGLISRGYDEFKAVTTKNADGYYGWEEHAPFDRIIVTCGIDHVPPPLLQQLKPQGAMLVPVGPPGAQRVLRIVKEQTADGGARISRSDIYNGRIVPFVPFKKLEGDKISGTHNT